MSVTKHFSLESSILIADASNKQGSMGDKPQYLPLAIGCLRICREHPMPLCRSPHRFVPARGCTHDQMHGRLPSPLCLPSECSELRREGAWGQRTARRRRAGGRRGGGRPGPRITRGPGSRPPTPAPRRRSPSPRPPRRWPRRWGPCRAGRRPAGAGRRGAGTGSGAAWWCRRPRRRHCAAASRRTAAGPGPCGARPGWRVACGTGPRCLRCLEGEVRVRLARWIQ